MARTGPSTTRPGPGTGVRLAARARSTRRSPNDDESGAQRRAARAAPVTPAPRTKRTIPKPSRTVRKLPAPPSLPQEPTNLESSPPGGFPPGGAGAEAAAGATCSVAAVTWEVPLGATGSGPSLRLTEGATSRPRPEDSSTRPRAPKSRDGAPTRKRKRPMMEVLLQLRDPNLHPPRSPSRGPLRTAGSSHKYPTPPPTRAPTPRPSPTAASPPAASRGPPDAGATAGPNTNRTSPHASGG